MVRRPSRLRSLADLGVNAESSAESLDRIARVACRVLDVPVALVNLVGEDRQRFVGCGGPEPWASMGGMPLTAGFCPFTLSVEEAYALDDTRADPASAVNPAVQRFGVAAYAGVPLRAPDAEPIGTFCALDTKPHPWSRDDLALLSDLAAGVMAELRLLAATRQLAHDQVRLQSLTALSSALAPAQRIGDVVDAVGRSVERLRPNAVWVSLAGEPGAVLRTDASNGAEPRQPDAVADVMRDAGSVAVLPLTAGERELGVLGVSFPDERAIPAVDQEFLVALSGITALAVANLQRPSY